MTTRASFITSALAAAFLLSAGALGQDQRKEDREAAKYYKKWLNQDVLYLITEEEREVFEKLVTPDEKDQFIEQFWSRRDPDLSTAINEYKEEHYRRLAYVNQHYGSGIPGWKTDRGRMYIAFGPPDEIEYHAGGNYLRKPWEGGGRTATFPFEIWYYRYLDGVGDDLEVEFVDRSFSGEFKMAIYAWEKDMLLHVDGLGETNAERLGLATRAQRPGLHPGNVNNLAWQKKFMGTRNKDMPFERMLRFFRLQRPPQIKQKELQKIVETRVTYDVLPLAVHMHHVWINDTTALVPITIEIPNEELDYIARDDIFKARVGIYGRVISMTGELASEFEQTLASEYKKQYFAAGQTQKSVFQKIVALKPGRHKVELVVKDLNSGDLATIFKSLYVPSLKDDKLLTSPLVLAKMLDSLEEFPEKPTSFMIGDVRVVPNVTGKFRNDQELGLYCQVHNAALDSSSATPSIEIEYSISRDGKIVTQVKDHSGNSVQYASEERLVLVRKLKLTDLKKGRYEVSIKINDSISGQSTQNKATFEIVG